MTPATHRARQLVRLAMDVADLAHRAEALGLSGAAGDLRAVKTAAEQAARFAAEEQPERVERR